MSLKVNISFITIPTITILSSVLFMLKDEVFGAMLIEMPSLQVSVIKSTLSMHVPASVVTHEPPNDKMSINIH
jgi:hypothetical protein